MVKATENFVSNYAFEHFADYGCQANGSVIPEYTYVAFLKVEVIFTVFQSVEN